MANWFQYNVTQGHATDDGVDIGTPSDTPVFMPFDGQVIDASYHVYGGQVVAAVPGTGYSEYFIHLDNLFVKPGDTIHAGQLIGTTGGGLGNKVVHNGVVQPAQAMSWYQGHSSGYHTEFGLFEGQTMAEFNQGWSNPSRQLDPSSILSELRAGQAPRWPGPGAPQALAGGLLGASGGAVLDALTKIFPWLGGSPEQIRFHLISGGVGLAGVGFIAFGLLSLYGATQDKSGVTVVVDAGKKAAERAKAARDEGIKTAVKAAEVAAV